MQLIISENTMCFKGKRHHMVSASVSTICPCRGLTCAPLSVITLGHFWFPLPGPWSPDARVWVRTNKSHLSSKPDGEREQPWEWKSTEEQPHPPCRGTQGQSLTVQFSRPNFWNVAGGCRARNCCFTQKVTFFSALVHYQQRACIFTLTAPIKLSKDAIGTKEVVSDETQTLPKVSIWPLSGS